MVQYPDVFQMASIEEPATKDEPSLAEAAGSDDVLSTSDRESVVTVRRIYVVDVRSGQRTTRSLTYNVYHLTLIVERPFLPSKCGRIA